jgi:hypothetical protein
LGTLKLTLLPIHESLVLWYVLLTTTCLEGIFGLILLCIYYRNTSLYEPCFCTEKDPDVVQSKQTEVRQPTEDDTLELREAVNSVMEDAKSLQFYEAFPDSCTNNLRKALRYLSYIRSWADSELG